jgi:hypothetical protein
MSFHPPPDLEMGDVIGDAPQFSSFVMHVTQCGNDRDRNHKINGHPLLSIFPFSVRSCYEEDQDFDSGRSRSRH